MTIKFLDINKSIRMYSLIAVSGIIIGLVAIYLIHGASGKLDLGPSCNVSQKIEANLQQFATGEIAAFLVSSKSHYVGDISFNDANGNQTSISDFQGSTILLNLWATWCAPCREEMPHLNVLQKELGGDEFSVVAISVDSGSPKKSKAFLEEVGANHLGHWTDSSMKILSDLRKIGRAPGLPTTLLIDGRGCELGALFGPANWASEEAKALVRVPWIASDS